MVFNVLQKFKEDCLQHDHDIYKKALQEIANGEGYYGAQAKEYKDIAKAALKSALVKKTQ